VTAAALRLERPEPIQAEGAFVELAREGDEPELRRLMRDVAMPGSIAVAFAREPDFYAAVGIEGERADIVVARESARPEHLVGLASHATRRVWVNGEQRSLGYLSMMRAEAGWRGRKISTAGFAMIRQLMERDGAPFAISTVIADNAQARAALERRHEGFPTFAPRERIVTLLSPTWKKRTPPSGVVVREATRADLGGIVRCLQDAGSRRHFAPAWTEADLLDPIRARGLRLEDFLVATDGPAIVGTVALWDQTAFKQSLVTSYRGALGVTRSLVNRVAPLFNVPTLPAPGSAFSYAYLSHLAANEADADITLALLLHGYGRARARGISYVTTGMSERDPRFSAIRTRLGGLAYPSVLYTVYWGERCAAVDALDDRPAHLEVAVL
jgi:hypothetical protein